MEKQDKRFFIIFTLVFTIWFLSIAIATRNKVIVKEDYIQNLEEKVNILTLDYENFAVEDSLRQSDGYERVR